MKITNLFRKKEQLSPTAKLPAHVAFIMDGNGRWAKKRGLARSAGHAEGARVVKRIVEDCFTMGVKTVTIYAFSTENWKRPQEEVDALMKLLDDNIVDRLSNEDLRYRIVFIGDRSALSDQTVEGMRQIEAKNVDSEYMLYVAFNYGGRAEICHAVNELIKEGKTSVTEDDISEKVYTHERPDPDLIIRTGGDVRISNFLMWQSAYAELWFTRTLWPDMKIGELKHIFENYGNTERRYGGVIDV